MVFKHFDWLSGYIVNLHEAFLFMLPEGSFQRGENRLFLLIDFNLRNY
jgi:hypothetical protein